MFSRGIGTVVLAVAVAAGATVAGDGRDAEAGGLPSGSFVALSYNVAGLPAGLSSSEPEVNSRLISPLLNDYDLVLLQENWADSPPVPTFDLYWDDITGAATHPHRSTPATNPLGANPFRPSALLADGLNRLSRLPFGPVNRKIWSRCNGITDGASDCLAMKGFSVARTEPVPGVPIDVYNLHAEAGGGPEDEAARAVGMRELASYIDTYSKGRAVIVGGDFNLHTGVPGVDRRVFERLLVNTGLADVCSVVTCADPGVIDKFLFRSSAAVRVTPTSHDFETDVFQRADGEPLSDHDPLAVGFEWEALLPPETPPEPDPPPAPDPPAPAPSGPVAARPAFTG